jgi:riboflavin kinase / FMN adenylyltransferase
VLKYQPINGLPSSTLTKMVIEKELAQHTPSRPLLLTIGVFDGVHMGHRYLLDQLSKRAREQGCLCGVVTFKTHPEKVLKRKIYLPWICTLQERIRLLKKAGVDVVVPVTFTSEVADLTAREFATLLKRHLKMSGLVLGPDFALGKGRKGDPEYLRKIGEDLGFRVEVVSPARLGDEIVSSSMIRRLLAEGNINRVEQMLGRPFHLEGRVMAGDQRGRKLGFPTANLRVQPEQAMPKDGIYVSVTHCQGKQYNSVTNIGVRPTFDGMKRLIETYILDFNENIYRKKLKIDLIQRLRDEMKFNHKEELITQMRVDVARAKKIFDQYSIEGRIR